MAKTRQKTTSEPLDFEVFKRLLKGLRNDGLYKWELYCTASFCTSLRVSDVKSTTWEELLYKNYFVKLEQKTQKVRQIPIAESFQKRLQELYDIMGHPPLDSSLIVNERSGEPMSTQYINRYIKNFIDWYNLPIHNFSTHSFRKTFGRHIWDLKGKTGEALTLLCWIFNHANPQLTMIYLGIRQEEVNEVFDQIDLD